jgi:guanylate kinase
MKRQIVVIAGPTASGETTFTKELMVAYPHFIKLISATTRSPRLTEQHKKDYYFFTLEEFLDQVHGGNIIEYTHVKNRDVYYGTYKPELDEKIAEGKTIVVNTDLSGARFFKHAYNAVTIFIKPKSIETIYHRLRRRDPTISNEELQMRLMNAMQEILDAENKYDYTVFNQDGEFADTIAKVIEILHREGYAV